MPPQDITYHIEASGDLMTWSEDPALVGLAAPVDDGNGITETVTAQMKTPVGQATREFMRVRVTLP